VTKKNNRVINISCVHLCKEINLEKKFYITFHILGSFDCLVKYPLKFGYVVFTLLPKKIFFFSSLKVSK